MEHDVERAQEIRRRKFEFHNSKWINTVHEGAAVQDAHYDEYAEQASLFFSMSHKSSFIKQEYGDGYAQPHSNQNYCLSLKNNFDSWSK